MHGANPSCVDRQDCRLRDPALGTPAPTTAKSNITSNGALSIPPCPSISPCVVARLVFLKPSPYPGPRSGARRLLPMHSPRASKAYLSNGSTQTGKSPVLISLFHTPPPCDEWEFSSKAVNKLLISAA